MTEKERREQARKAGLASAAKRWGAKEPKQTGTSLKAGTGRRGPRTDEERAAQSEKMRAYWAKRKAIERAPNGAG